MSRPSSFVLALLLLPLQGAALAADSPAALWDDLADRDAAKAFRAIDGLIAGPDRAVELLKERLRPAKAPDRARIARLIADLDSDNFDTREKATAELKALGESAESALKKALASKPPPELRKRAEDLLAALQAEVPPPQRLRELRAVEILEAIGTAGARRVLEGLAAGPEDAWLTQEAERSATRLVRRDAPPPAVAVKPDPALGTLPKGAVLQLGGAGFLHRFGASALVFWTELSRRCPGMWSLIVHLIAVKSLRVEAP